MRISSLVFTNSSSNVLPNSSFIFRDLHNSGVDLLRNYFILVLYVQMVSRLSSLLRQLMYQN